MMLKYESVGFFFFQAEDGIRDGRVTGVQTCALPISRSRPSDPYRRGSYARAENPVVRYIRTMLWPCEPRSPRGPQWCSDEATSQRCGLTGENLVAAACQEVTGYRQSAASQSVSRSIARSRIRGEGGISGMGGCKIGSRRGLVQAGNAGPRSP